MHTFKPESTKLSAEEKLNLLVEFGTRISSELRLDKLLDIIAQQITAMLDVGRCTVFLEDVVEADHGNIVALVILHGFQPACHIGREGLDDRQPFRLGGSC